MRFIPAPSPKSIGAIFPGEQRRHERADQRDVRGLRIGLRFGLVKLADLRAGEALERVRAGARGGEFDAAELFPDFSAFLGGRGIHPDGRGLARKHAVQIFHQRFLGIQLGQRTGGAVVEINRAVLLAAAADGECSSAPPRPSSSGQTRGPKRRPKQGSNTKPSQVDVHKKECIAATRTALKYKALNEEKESIPYKPGGYLQDVRDAIITVDKETVVIELNEAAMTMCGYSRDDIGKSFSSYPRCATEDV